MRNLEEYHRPQSVAEAVDLKNEYGARALYLAGGSDILVHRPDDIRALIDIRHIGLDYMRHDSDCYVIGGAALLRDVEAAGGEIAGGMLRTAIRETAPWLIRNAATVAGNIANASPAADSVPALIALDAELILVDGEEESVPLQDVLMGPHQTAVGNRLIREIRISADAAQRQGRFIKLARSKSDICQVNVAVALVSEGRVARDVRIVLGAVAPTAMRARRAESMLEGQAVTQELLEEVEAVVRAEVRPIGDWRASEEYRRRMSGLLVRRLLTSLLPESKIGAV